MGLGIAIAIGMVLVVPLGLRRVEAVSLPGQRVLDLARTGSLPAGVHAVMAYSCLALNLGALRVEVNALTESGRIVSEVNQLLNA